jgi:LemA protein
MSDWLTASLVAAVLLFWAVGAYNRLMRLRSQALQAFGALAVQLRRHIALAQSCATAVKAASNARAAAGAAVGAATEAATGTAADFAASADALPIDPAVSASAGLEAAAAQYLASLTAAKVKPLDPATIAALAAARGVLVMAWQRLANEPHDLAGAPLPESMRVEWEHAVQQGTSATEEFNAAVERYNEAVSQFPAQLLAWLFGFRAARPL